MSRRQTDVLFFTNFYKNLLGINLSDETLNAMASRFNNKKGSLSFDDFLQIICRIYSLKGVNHYLVMWWLLLSLSSPLGQGSGSLRKQPTFHDVTTGLLMKWRLRNELRKSILMTRHYLGGVSDWLKQIVSQSEALLGSDVIIMEFLHSFLGRHFLGKPQWWRR